MSLDSSRGAPSFSLAEWRRLEADRRLVLVAHALRRGSEIPDLQPVAL